MILRRIAEAIRQQNWFTVRVEIMIVVLGVFLGLQVNNWNEARADLVTDMTELQRHRAFWGQVTGEGYAAIRYAETGDECPPPEGSSDTVEILEQLAADREIMDALRYWIDTQRMTV